MNFRKSAVWTAAALTVAMGAAAGAAWAQTLNYDLSPIKTNSSLTVQTSLTKTGNMMVTYAVTAPTATVTFTNKTNTGEPFLKYNVKTEQTGVGNSGTIKVTTEANFWDIEFYTANKGTLKLGGNGATLKVGPLSSPAEKWDAVYGVQIGILKNNAGKLVTEVDSESVRAAALAAPIAFSQVFGYYAADTTGVAEELGNRQAYHDSEPAINALGFAKPLTTDKSITFLVNTGLGIDGVGDVIVKGNAAGTYTDTLKFTFTAAMY